VEIPGILKQPPVLIGVALVIVIIIAVSRKSGDSGALQTTAGGQDPAIEQAQISAGLEATKAGYGAQVSLADIDAQKIVALTKLATDTQLGLVGLDYQHDVAVRAISSAEIQQARDLQLKQAEIDANERIANFTTSRALTYAQIQGVNQIGAIKASQPSIWGGFLTGLGRGIGGGLSTFLGGL
jgi:hypothetical protein